MAAKYFMCMTFSPVRTPACRTRGIAAMRRAAANFLPESVGSGIPAVKVWHPYNLMNLI